MRIEAEIYGSQGRHWCTASCGRGRGRRKNKGTRLGGRDGNLAQLAGKHALLQGLRLGEAVVDIMGTNAHGRRGWHGWSHLEPLGLLGEHHVLGILNAMLDHTCPDDIPNLGHVGTVIIRGVTLAVAHARRQLEMRVVHMRTDDIVDAGAGEELLGNDEVEGEGISVASFGHAWMRVVGVGDGHDQLEKDMAGRRARSSRGGRDALDKGLGGASSVISTTSNRAVLGAVICTRPDSGSALV